MEISPPPGEKRIVFKEMKKREIGERRKFGFGSENIYIYIFGLENGLENDDDDDDRHQTRGFVSNSLFCKIN